MTAVLGISGLADSVRFKQQHWPGLDEREYRISQGHDAAAALVVDGQIVAAAAEERFDRRKHSSAFPAGAAAFCLNQAGLRLADIDEIAHCFNYAPYAEIFSLDSISQRLYDQVFSKAALLTQVDEHFRGFSSARVHQVNHHLCHAASAFFCSGWDESLIAVIDAMGEVEGASIYRARGTEITRLGQLSANDSIGVLYSLVTLHLGFDFNSDEYKIMGLAPYGDPRRFESVFARMIEYRPDGSLRIPILRLNRTRDERENYLATRAWLDANLLPCRAPEADLTQDHRDVAAALQACLNRAVLHMCRHFAEKTGLRRLAMAGGVALNCTANGLLMRSGLFDDLFVQPAAGDDGGALGAALFRSSLKSEIGRQRLRTPLLGPEYSRAAVEAALDRFRDCIRVTRFERFAELCLEAARWIQDGKVLGWYRGRMEFGPRALGNRSILADPAHPEMRDRINAMVKLREAFRPFAPAVSIEQVDRWFDVPPMTALPYMIATVDVRQEYRDTLPAVTHVDGSARVQTVSVEDNPDFHHLLQAVGQRTGREMVLNTSFNVKGQPIVNTPDEALETFLGTGIDGLFIDSFLVTRPAASC